MPKTYRVKSSPFDEDYAEGCSPPWDYKARGLVVWVDEVFLERYKRDAPLPTVDEALDVLRERGYEVKVIDE